MRLIDADALMEVYARYEFSSDMGDAIEILDNFPTIQCNNCRDYCTIYCPCEWKSEPNWVCGDWHERKDND